MSLYYLLASLPMLKLDAAPGISTEKFVEACHEQLSEPDAAAAAALLRGEHSDHPFAAAWRDKDTILRNAIARERARAAGADAARWTRPAAGCDSQIENEVDEAFQEADPLRRERALDKVRWLIADELQGPDPLSVKVALAYALKLALATRWARFDTEQGRKTFDALTRVPLNL